MITALVLNIWNTWPIENTFCFLGCVKNISSKEKNPDWILCMTTGNPIKDDLFVDVRNQYFTVLENCASILPRGGEQSAWQHYLGIPELIFLELNETVAH